MSKRKHRDQDDPPAPADAPTKEEVIVADPPQPNAAFLGATAALYAAWLAFLLWMTLAR